MSCFDEGTVSGFWMGFEMINIKLNEIMRKREASEGLLGHYGKSVLIVWFSFCTVPWFRYWQEP
jgi:hypothetical protein